MGFTINRLNRKRQKIIIAFASIAVIATVAFSGINYFSGSDLVKKPEIKKEAKKSENKKEIKKTENKKEVKKSDIKKPQVKKRQKKMIKNLNLRLKKM